MSTQPANQTAADLAEQVLMAQGGYLHGRLSKDERDKLVSQSIKNLYDLAVAALPEKQEIYLTSVYSANQHGRHEQIKPKINRWAQGYNQAIDEAKANLAQVFNQEKTNDQ